MLVVHVHVHVKSEHVQSFEQASLDNARQSLTEPGVARFDVIQDLTDPTHFVLVEVYKSDAAPAAHKETEHYKLWRDKVADMMARPRESQKYESRFPEPAGYETPL